MGFIMEGLAAEGYDRKYSDSALVRRVGSYFRPVIGLMVFVAIMIVLNALMDAVLPWMIKLGIDAVISEESVSQSASFRWIIFAILASGALSWTFNFLRQWLTARTVGDVVLAVRRDAFDAVMARDMSFYDEYPSGKIVSRVTSDTQDFANVVTLTLNLLSQVLLVFLLAGVLFYVNGRLALLALTISPFIVFVALSFRRIARRSTRDARRIMATVNETVQETIRGIRVAKGFRQERAIYDTFEDVNAQAYRVNLRQGYVFSSIFPLLGTVAGVGTFLVILYGGRMALSGTVTPGEWYYFIQAVALFWFPLTSIASFWSQFQLGLSASERVFALIDAEPRVQQLAETSAAPTLAGRVEFQNVDFEYVEGEPVLRGFDLDIAGGETVALVGHTGAGKSSIAKLVSRFYEFQSGKILIDGRDIRSLELPSFRRQLGIVPQVPFLFRGTVADNIKYARQDATPAEIEAAARSVAGGDWLDALETGLETRVGEMGRGLSMGQRQLVVLARLLLQNPAVIILDEATASIDPLTEAQIQEGLEVVMAERTGIVIAHRLSTIRNVDRIIVLADGAIIEEGTHDSLIAAGGHYAELYNTYFRHQSADYRPGEGFVSIEADHPISTSGADEI